MCCGCWKEDGSPQIDNEKVRGIQPLIDKVDEFGGGNLHIVINNNNLEDGHLNFCEQEIIEAEKRGMNDWGDDNTEAIAAERACLKALRAMTYDERVSAMGLWDGCWK